MVSNNSRTKKIICLEKFSRCPHVLAIPESYDSTYFSTLTPYLHLLAPVALVSAVGCVS